MISAGPKEELIHQVGLSFLPDIGPVKARALLAHCGSASGVFRERKRILETIPGIGPALASVIRNREALKRAEKEIDYTFRSSIRIFFITDEDYPSRLKHCEDAPLVLYFKGNAQLDLARVIGIIGSRNATDYGRLFCEKLIDDLAQHHPMIVSGLAYGIDIQAHRKALKAQLPTVAVLAHGLDMIYPSQHKHTAEKMTEQGGLITEFPSGTKLHPDFFPKRNRIIAGLSDALVVVEAGMRSGSLVTAGLANDYNRDVFAVPGRLNDPSSEGCNYLIKTHKAALIQSAKDIEYIMGWEKKDKKVLQTSLFHDLNAEERCLVETLQARGPLQIDELCLTTGIALGKTLSLLLSLEFNGIVKSLPGKVYRIL